MRPPRTKKRHHGDEERRQEAAQRRTNRMLRTLIHQGEHIMATVQELNDKLDAQKVAIAEVGTDLASALARVQVDVDFLKTQAQAGVDLGPAMAKLDESMQSLQAVSTSLKALDPVPDNPPVEPPPPSEFRRR